MLLKTILWIPPQMPSATCCYSTSSSLRHRAAMLPIYSWKVHFVALPPNICRWNMSVKSAQQKSAHPPGKGCPQPPWQWGVELLHSTPRLHTQGTEVLQSNQRDFKIKINIPMLKPRISQPLDRMNITVVSGPSSAFIVENASNLRCSHTSRSCFGG